MPSEAAQASGDGKVHCRMIHDQIPVQICEEEQGVAECEGCSAPTRRCAACKKARGMADPVQCLCEACLNVNGGAVSHPLFEGTADQALETVLGRVRKIAMDLDGIQLSDRNPEFLEQLRLALTDLEERKSDIIRLRCGLDDDPLTLEEVGERFEVSRQRVKQLEDDALELIEHRTGISQVDIRALMKPERKDSAISQESLAPSLHVKKPAALYPTIMEHGNERGGLWRVKAPVTVLTRRFHLLPDEAVEVLAALAKEKYVQGQAPWDEIILLKTEGIQELRDEIDHPRAQASTKKRRNLRADKSQMPETPASAHLAERTAATKKVLEGLPSQKPLANYGEIYAYLKSRSHEVHGERLIGGSVPALQIRFKLSAVQAMESLEWLRANKHIQQKDGWRTIVLLSGEVESCEGPAKSDTRSRVTVAPPEPIRVAKSASEAVSPMKSVQAPRTLDAVLSELERALPALRQRRDEFAICVAQLEASYMALKAMRVQLGQTKQIADEALAEAVKATQALLIFLRR